MFWAPWQWQKSVAQSHQASPETAWRGLLCSSLCAAGDVETLQGPIHLVWPDSGALKDGKVQAYKSVRDWKGEGKKSGGQQGPCALDWRLRGSELNPQSHRRRQLVAPSQLAHIPFLFLVLCVCVHKHIRSTILSVLHLMLLSTHPSNQHSTLSVWFLTAINILYT
jgi:hypothetical protein